MSKSKKKRKNKFWRIILEIIKIPYYIIKYTIKGIKYLIKLFQKKKKEIKVEKKRKRRYPKYKNFKVIKKEKGDFDKLEKSFLNDKGKIGIILGGRGSGKTALGVKFRKCLFKNQEKMFFNRVKKRRSSFMDKSH